MKNKWIVDKVDYQILFVGYITRIKLTNGFELIPGEDTGGELAALEVESKSKLEKGDCIYFDKKLDINNDMEDIERININGEYFKSNVGSEGGNTSTFLSYRKSK